MVKVSKITKVRKGNRTFYVLEKEDLPDIKGRQEEYLEADKMGRELAPDIKKCLDNYLIDKHEYEKKQRKKVWLIYSAQ